MKIIFAQRNNYPRTSSPYQLLYLMSNFEYIDFDTLMSSKEVADTLSGSCHDQVIFELDELSKQGLNPKAKFLIAVDPDGNGGETHSFVFYQEDSKLYWFENAWKDYRGIHEFDTEHELLDFVLDAFADRNPGKEVFVGAFIPEEHHIGEDLQTLVDICMDNAVQA